MPPTLRIRFIGSGDAFGSGGRFQACILLSSDGSEMLLDCGATSLVALKRANIDPTAIDTVLVSHLHGDHFGGIPFLVLDGQFSGRTSRLLVAGPPGLADRATQAMEVLFPGSADARRKFVTEFQQLAGGQTTEIGSTRVTAFEVTHASGAPSFAFRVEVAGRTIGYSGDTEWTDALIPVARGADLFICEAYYYEKDIPFHLNFRTLMEHRSELDCERIVLTHMSADMLARLADLDIEASHDGLEIEL